LVSIQNDNCSRCDFHREKNDGFVCTKMRSLGIESMKRTNTNLRIWSFWERTGREQWRLEHTRQQNGENYSEWGLPGINGQRKLLFFNGFEWGQWAGKWTLIFALECPPNNSDNLLVDAAFHLLVRSFFEVLSFFAFSWASTPIQRLLFATEGDGFPKSQFPESGTRALSAGCGLCPLWTAWIFILSIFYN
jgi:hypothetical protein